MKDLSIDIETYSDVDIKKSGLYKYVQSPSFQIMLFAYKVDSEPVRIVDLMNAETIPVDVLSAMADARVTKHAYNAAFEWYCLSKHFGFNDNMAFLGCHSGGVQCSTDCT